MAVRVVEDMLDYMATNTGACVLQLRDVVGTAAREAMERAGDAVSDVEHPEEESEPLPSYVSVAEIGDGAAITSSKNSKPPSSRRFACGGPSTTHSTSVSSIACATSVSRPTRSERALDVKSTCHVTKPRDEDS